AYVQVRGIEISNRADPAGRSHHYNEHGSRVQVPAPGGAFSPGVLGRLRDEPLPCCWRIVMRAIVIEKFGGPDCLVYKDLPEPEPLAGHVVIEVKAFGLNHAEMHMRRGEWAEAAPVSGIECVGLVKAAPGGELPIGTKVAALMGGLGRTINGSYAE